MNAELLRDAYVNALVRKARRDKVKKTCRNFSPVHIYLMREKVGQTEIADALGLQRTTMSALFAGRLVVDRHLNAIASYLGISRKKLDAMIRGRRAA